MPLDAEFFRIAHTHFNPYSRFSGTEHIGPLLYALARMTRPRVVVEYGSGYSTLFILRALADNVEDAEAERHLLISKTKQIFANRSSTLTALNESETHLAEQWLDAGGKACGVDPKFYLEAYSPQLFSIEQQDKAHPYAQELAESVRKMGHQNLFTHLCGSHFKNGTLDASTQPIDWAWNDMDEYYDFFQEFWERLNPAGGLLIFHNVPSDADWYAAIHRMKQDREAHGDLEVLILEEPHKFTQNGCAILRRTSAYRPRFLQDLNPLDVMLNLERLMTR